MNLNPSRQHVVGRPASQVCRRQAGSDQLEHRSCAELGPPERAGARAQVPLERPISTGPQPMHNLRDFRPDVRDACEELRRSGFDREAYVLIASMEGAYSTALEMLQAIGGAVLRVERALGAELPGDVSAAFQRALAEVARVVAALTSPGATPPVVLPTAPAGTASCSSN